MRTSEQARQVPLEVRVGMVLAGRYRIERLLGAGGMGVVFAGRHLQLDEPVALKFLLPEIEEDPEAKSRFEREALTTAKIKSEHVVRVMDVGELPSGAPFIVMEYLDGTDLASVVAEQKRLPIAQAVRFAVQACEGVAEAHALGVVHRDLKPSNVFCVQRSDGLTAIKVLDFGMSKLLRRNELGFSQSITAPSVIVGSPLYMSPEQMNSAKEVDGRTDIWSLGVILYQLLAGELPFAAQTFPELAVKIAVHPPASLRAYREEVPRGLERIILRCLEKDRNKRFADVAQLAAALAEYGPPDARAHAERAARVLGAQSLELIAGGAQTAGTTRHSAMPVARSQPAPGDSRPSRLWLLAAGVLVLAALTPLSDVRVSPPEVPSAGVAKPVAAAASPALAQVPEVAPAPQPSAASEDQPAAPLSAVPQVANAAAVSLEVSTAAAPPPKVSTAVAPPPKDNTAAVPAAKDGTAAVPAPQVSIPKPAARKPKPLAQTVTPPAQPAPVRIAPVALDPPQDELNELGGRH